MQLIYNFSHFSKKERNWKKIQEAAGEEDDGEEDPLHKLAQRREDKKSEIYTLITSTFFLQQRIQQTLTIKFHFNNDVSLEFFLIYNFI